ncbi:MAG TPA: DUF4915 domain-containing protein [Acidimicrobiia bacterium]|nr:DUF4915 domain-containing protein [Acidimicrobiia bacterium]
MRALVSFCNPRSSPRLAVCAVDLESGARAWLPVPESFEGGAAGITADGDDRFVACQAGGIVRYGPEMEPIATLPTPNARNLHSILYLPDENALLVISAHNDTLFRFRLSDDRTSVVASEEVYCADPERRGLDRYHINSVAVWRGDIYVTVFGPASGPTHLHRRHGRALRVSDGETIADDLYHPHSLFVHGESLLVIESQARCVRRIGGGDAVSWSVPGGYPRGIAAGTGTRVWIGTSALRRESSSMGTPNVITSADPDDFKTRLVELDLATGEVGRTIDLTLLAAEIFDLNSIPDAWEFRPSPDGGLRERVEALETTYQTLRSAQLVAQAKAGRGVLARARESAQRLARRFARS